MRDFRRSMASPDAKVSDAEPKQPPRFPWRAVLIGSLLIPANAFWIIRGELITASIHATILSLFFNVIATLFVLIGLNALWKGISPRSALSPAELLVIYVMLSVSTGLFGVDFLQMLVVNLGHPYRFATDSNGWQTLFFHYLPGWLTVSNPEALKGLYEGHATFFRGPVMAAWVVPLLAWFGFTMVLLWMCLCLNVLVRRSWSEHERLTFPVIQLPMQMIQPSPGFYSNRLLWAGFCVAALLNILRAGHSLLPAIPEVVTKTDLSQYFVSAPWNAIGWTPLAVYPFAVGLGFLIPLDLSFSCWFFFVLWKATVIFRAAMGWEPMAGQYGGNMGDQSPGAWLGIGMLALWGSRKPLIQVVRSALKRGTGAGDAQEPMRYRTAVIGLAAGALALTVFCLAAGMALWAVGAFWGLYFLLMLAIMRMRAEMGPPSHDLYYGGPDRILTITLGTGVIPGGTLTLFALLYWITRGFRSHPVAHQLEGFKMAERSAISGKTLAGIMMLAAAVGYTAWCLLSLICAYRYGFSAKMHSSMVWASWEAWNHLTGWLTHPGPPEAASWQQFSLGFGLTVGMMALRKSFLWFPWHPVGYAVAGSWTMSWLWFSMLLSWLVKWLLLRHGGLKAYRSALPLFFGFILGDYVVGGLQSLLPGPPLHGFFPY